MTVFVDRLMALLLPAEYTTPMTSQELGYVVLMIVVVVMTVVLWKG